MKNYKVLVVIIFFAALGYVLINKFNLSKNTQPFKSKTINTTISVVDKTNKIDREIIAQNLKIPWEIVFLPDDEMLITLRPGKLLKIGKDKKIINIEGVHHFGEGGLLGLTLHPDFSKNNFIYLYLTSQQNGKTVNRVERYKLIDSKLSDRKVIIDGIQGSIFHDGGRIAFGPDGYLYITTGDAQNTKLAQDKNSLNGKILRVKDDGSIPVDNPFANAVYSYGHRNVQGITWDKSGNLWATEHGRSGIQSGLDELNFIEKGKNYGWSVIQGDEKRENMISPIIHSGPNETWAPSGMVYFKGSIFFAGLRGETLYEAIINPDLIGVDGKSITSFKKHLRGEYGRLRTVQLGPDGYLYVLTNNTDGRGKPKESDDQLIKINPDSLE